MDTDQYESDSSSSSSTTSCTADEETHGGGQIQGYIKEPEVKLDLCITNIGTIYNTFVLVIAARLYNCSNHLATLFSG